MPYIHSVSDFSEHITDCPANGFPSEYCGYGTDITDLFEYDVIRRYMLLGIDAELSNEEQNMLRSLPGPHLWNTYGHISDDGFDTDKMPVSVRPNRMDVEIILLEEEEFPNKLPIYSCYDDMMSYIMEGISLVA